MRKDQQELEAYCTEYGIKKIGSMHVAARWIVGPSDRHMPVWDGGRWTTTLLTWSMFIEYMQGGS